MDFSTLERRLKSEVAKGKLTHFYLAGGALGEQQPKFAVHHLPGGASYFDYASLTKALLTSVLVWKASAEDPSLLSTSFKHFFPELRLGHWLNNLNLRQLISHDSGVVSWRSYWMYSRLYSSLKPDLFTWLSDEKVNFWQPGNRTEYSDIGFLIIGLFLERFFSNKIETLWKELQIELGLNKDEIRFAPIARKDAIPTAYCKIRRRWLQGEVHDENCWALNGVSTHAGLFGTGEGLWNFLSNLFTSKVGESLVCNGTIYKEGEKTLLGWDKAISLKFKTHHTLVGHLGFTGTAFWVCPVRNIGLILLTNRTISGRDGKWMSPLRAYLFSNLIDLLKEK